MDEDVRYGWRGRDNLYLLPAGASTPDGRGGLLIVKDVHEIEVCDLSGKQTATLLHCCHCGSLMEKPVEQSGRTECPTCGEDPERELAAVEAAS